MRIRILTTLLVLIVATGITFRSFVTMAVAHNLEVANDIWDEPGWRDERVIVWSGDDDPNDDELDPWDLPLPPIDPPDGMQCQSRYVSSATLCDATEDAPTLCGRKDKEVYHGDAHK